jgi:hypothetical protein
LNIDMPDAARVLSGANDFAKEQGVVVFDRDRSGGGHAHLRKKAEALAFDAPEFATYLLFLP